MLAAVSCVRYLPASTWQLELFLALFSTLLLFLLLTHRVPPLSHINLFPSLTVPLSTLLLLDSYLTLSTLEQRYSSGESGSTVLSNDDGSAAAAGGGWTLNARRFREQRDVYLALFYDCGWCNDTVCERVEPAAESIAG